MPLAILPLLLAQGSLPPAPPPPPPLPPTSPMTTRRGTPMAEAIGQPAAAARVEALRRQAGARDVRIVRRGDFITMDHIAGRLTIVIDDGGRIVDIYDG